MPTRCMDCGRPQKSIDEDKCPNCGGSFITQKFSLVACPSCGEDNSRSNNSCWSCGARL
ncbi:zinc ribbon domain-containing protein [Natronoglomus mannanivorans]|uniref:zinc ribbon domain-containing protein n=1 Tax=Natronoglomus mannanivorans TaxID=2979990 RepID=UPI003CCD6AA9